jgi:hypothetical protein
MSNIYEERPQPLTLEGVWAGTIAKAPVSDYAPCEVLINAFDSVHRFGPAKWGPRDTNGLPERGDACIVVFDEQNIPYVIGWWPV